MRAQQLANFKLVFQRPEFQIMFYIENAFDKDRYTGTFDSAFPVGLYALPDPRQIGFLVAFKFD